MPPSDTQKAMARNPVCALLGIRYPVIQGGMTLVGDSKLAAAVSEGGGLGVVSAGRTSPETFAEELDLALKLTDQPVAVNIPIGHAPEWTQACFDIALTRDICMAFIGGGNPKPWCPQVKKAGKRLGIVVASPHHAMRAEQVGADLIVAEGIEAGGRTSPDELAALVLIPATAAAISVPLVAAGSIVDGRGLAAALCLGAQGVQLGTRFMLAEESPVHDLTRQAMLAATVSDTMVIGNSHRIGRRVLRGPAAEHVRSQERTAALEDMIAMLSGEFGRLGLRQGDLQVGMVTCGQGVGLIDEVLPAARIISNMVEGAMASLDHARTTLAFDPTPAATA